MHNVLRRISYIPLIIFIALQAVVQPPIAYADVPYKTYYKDHYNEYYETQAAYTPSGTVGDALYIERDGELEHSPLQQPQDLFIDANNHLYIADTGNHRVVHLDEHGELVRIINPSEDPFNRPQGIFIDEQGEIYIADTGNQRIVKLDQEGNVLMEYRKPDSSLLPEQYNFDPIRLVVDKRGFLYIATLGGYQGLLVLDPNGQFQGFFGANQTSFTLIDRVKRLMYSREMLERETSKLPGSITSTAVDRYGFIYTVTKEVQSGQVKKLNIAGLDQLKGKSEYSLSDGAAAFGEHLPYYFNRDEQFHQRAQLNDLTIDGDGNVTVIDSRLNVISQYDMNGNLLFFWGGSTQDATAKLGKIKLPAAVANDSSNNLYILDSENHIVQIFILSEFGQLVHAANALTQDGRYEESEPLWEQVIRLNAYYTPAVLGLAKAAYKKGEYEKAAQLFESIGAPQGYSDSFWQNRLQWFQRQFGQYMNAIIVMIALWSVFTWLSRKRGWILSLKWKQSPKLWKQLVHIRAMATRPIDSFQALRYEDKGSLLSANLLLVLAVSAYAVMSAKTHFLFNPQVIVKQELFTPIVQFLSIWLAYVVANYLVSSLIHGEGRLRDVYIGSSYAMFPFIFIGLPVIMLSHLLTLNEAAIFHFFYYGMYGWVLLLLFWKVQGIHNFSVGEAIKSLLLTIVTMAVLALLLFLIFSLTSELVSFIYAVYQEVVIR